MQDRIGRAGLQDRIRFLGELPWDRLVRHYQALDLFAAPARWEGFGLTPLEAMACGVPAIGARVGAYEALIRDGETGSLVQTGDAGALSAALARWLDDDAARAALERAGKDYAKRFKVWRNRKENDDNWDKGGTWVGKASMSARHRSDERLEHTRSSVSSRRRVSA